MSEISTADILSLTWFAIVWVGYTWYADRGPWPKHSLRAVMHTHREEWMRQMALRDNRVADVNILRNLLQGVSFFASTTLLILAGLLAILGASDRGIEIVRAPFRVRNATVRPSAEYDGARTIMVVVRAVTRPLAPSKL